MARETDSEWTFKNESRYRKVVEQLKHGNVEQLKARQYDKIVKAITGAPTSRVMDSPIMLGRILQILEEVSDLEAFVKEYDYRKAKAVGESPEVRTGAELPA